jgi:hypothetical protein
MDKVITWLEARSRWGRLRTLGDSSLVKASVLMPAFGYMLLLNDNVHQYLTIKYDGWLLKYLPSIWRIWLLFYGSFLVATGSILYTTFCPVEVKRYTSEFEMADAEGDHLTRLGQYPQVREQVVRLHSSLSDRQRALLPMQRGEIILSNVTELNVFSISKLLVLQWMVVNIGKPAVRIAIVLLFSLGLGLLAIPAAFTFVQVTVLAAKRILG